MQVLGAGSGSGTRLSTTLDGEHSSWHGPAGISQVMPMHNLGVITGWRHHQQAAVMWLSFLKEKNILAGYMQTVLQYSLSAEMEKGLMPTLLADAARRVRGHRIGVGSRDSWLSILCSSHFT